jgi:hypothetical protein
LVAALLRSEGRLERERLGAALLEALNDGFHLPGCGLTVAPRAQTHATDSRGRLAQKTYGYYRCRIPQPGAVPERCAIRIYHLTAIRSQVLAPTAFTSTLLHEWTHHFDFTGLRLGRSPHTRGFYARLAWLTTALGQGVASEAEASWARANALPPDARLQASIPAVCPRSAVPGHVDHPPAKWCRPTQGRLHDQPAAPNRQASAGDLPLPTRAGGFAVASLMNSRKEDR